MEKEYALLICRGFQTCSSSSTLICSPPVLLKGRLQGGNWDYREATEEPRLYLDDPERECLLKFCTLGT